MKTTVVTVTFYDLQNPGMLCRSHLALQTIQDAVARDCEVFIVDGGSNEEFIEQARSLGAHLFQQQGRGISGAQQQAIAAAHQEADPDAYILIEPEKAGLLKNHFAEITSPVYNDEADLVLVGRTEQAMRTMTRMQRLTETKLNEVESGIIGMDADYCMAPRVWNAEITPYFLNYTPTKNWDLFHGPVIDAIIAGKRILPVAIPYVYPKEMIAHEEGDEAFEKKRIDQLMEVTDFVKDHWPKQ